MAVVHSSPDPQFEEAARARVRWLSRPQPAPCIALLLSVMRCHMYLKESSDLGACAGKVQDAHRHSSQLIGVAQCHIHHCHITGGAAGAGDCGVPARAAGLAAPAARGARYASALHWIPLCSSLRPCPLLGKSACETLLQSCAVYQHGPHRGRGTSGRAGAPGRGCRQGCAAGSRLGSLRRARGRDQPPAC